MKQRILFLPEWFYPEIASTAQLMSDLVFSLSNQYDITVVSRSPCSSGSMIPPYQFYKRYEEDVKGVHVIFTKEKPYNKKSKFSRFLGICRYFLQAKKEIRHCGRFDLVFSLGQPPLLGGMIAMYAKKKTGGKLIYNIQDFYPESLKVLGYVRLRFPLFVAQKIDNRACSSSDLVVVVGRDMTATLEKRFYKRSLPNNVVINNWIDENQISPLPKTNPGVSRFIDEHGLKDKLVFMYSGSLGLRYDLVNLVNVLTSFKSDDIRFVFVGEGVCKSEAENLVREKRCRNFLFLPYQPKDELIYSLNSADVHFVFSAKSMKGISVPSKVYGVFAVNKPIIGVMDSDTDAACLIRESGSGLLVAPNDYLAFQKAISQVIRDPDVFVSKHSCGRIYLEKNLSKEISINKYQAAFSSLLGAKRGN